MPGGRPPEPVPHDIAEAIIDWLYEGGSLLAFCRQPGMPNRRTIYDWCDKDQAFASRFARASKSRGPLLMEMGQEIADDSSRDYLEVEGKNGQPRRVLDSEHVQRSKLRVDQMNRRAACYSPAECGTKVALGGDAVAPPIRIESTGPIVPPLDDYPDPVTGKTRQGLLSGIRKLGELASEVLDDSGEDRSATGTRGDV